MTEKTGNSYLHPWASAFLFSDGSKPANWYDSEKHCKDTKFLGIYIALSQKNKNNLSRGMWNHFLGEKWQKRR